MIDKRLAFAVVLAIALVGFTGLSLTDGMDADDQYFVEDGFRFVVTSDSTVSVAPLESGQYETNNVLEIPAKVTHSGKQYSVTGIADKTFMNTSKLNAVSIPEGIVTIGAHAFDGSAIYQDLTLPSTVTTIGEAAFNKTTITGLDLTKCKVTDIPSQAFASCSLLKKVSIGSSVKTLGEGAFQGCRLVNSLDLSAATSIQSIGSKAFQQISSGAAAGIEIKLAASVTSMTEDSFSGAKVSSYTIDSSNSVYQSVNGAILTKDGTTLLFYPIANGSSEAVIPAGVTKLGANALYYGSAIKKVTLDNAVQVGEYSLTMTNIKTMQITQTAALPSGYSGIIATYFTKDDGYWTFNNITIDHLIIDSSFAVDLTGLIGKTGKYVDFTAQSTATIGGKFTKDGAEVTGADRAGYRFTNNATASTSDNFVYDTMRFIEAINDPSEGGSFNTPEKAEIGSTVTLTATPLSGFKFGWWGDDKSKTDPTYTFTMPSTDTTITAHWIMIENCYYTVPTKAQFEMTKYLGGAPENKNPSSYNYYNFQHIDPVSTKDNGDGTTTYVYILEDGKYGAVTKGSDYVTFKELLTKKKNTEIKSTVTEAMLKPTGKTSTTIDRTVAKKLGDDVGGILVSGNKANHIYLSNGQELPMMVYRQWQAVSDTMNNPFLEPEIVYTVTDFSGKTVTDIISIENGPAGDTTWKIKGLKEGTVVVTVWMKAMTYQNGNFVDFFGATWPELTQVFVVTVGKEASFDTGMTMYDESDKIDRAIDCDMDVCYYDWNSPGYNFTFKPASGTKVTVYNPILATNGIKGFTTGTATQSGDSWTVLLTEGRNVIAMENNGEVRYQVLLAMPVKIIVNGVDSSSATLNPGQDNTIAFMSTHGNYGGIFNSKGKLAGIYNCGTTIWYDDEAGNRAGTAKQPQWGYYFFLTKPEFQTVSVNIPADWDVSKKYTLHPKGIVITGIDGNGDHRTWFYKSSSALGLHRNAFLPEISLRVAGGVAEAELSTDGGQTWTEYNTFGLALAASGDGDIIKVNVDSLPDSISKKIEIRMNGHTFLDSGKPLTLYTEVKIFGFNPLKNQNIVFGSDGKLITDSTMDIVATFENPAASVGKTFITGSIATSIAVNNAGYASYDTKDGVTLFRTVDLPFGIYNTERKEFSFYATFEEALTRLSGESVVYILNYQPQYTGGAVKKDYNDVNAQISMDLTLKTVVRVTDGTYSTYYVDGKAVTNNGKEIALPSVADLSTSIDGDFFVDGGHTLTINDVAVLNDIVLGGGKGTAAGIAKIKLDKNVPMFRLAVNFDKLADWTKKEQTPEGTVYMLDPECAYEFVTSTSISLNDRVGINASGFKANIAPGGLSATLAASSSMIAYVQTGEQSFTGYSSLEDAITAAGTGTVYILYRTTNVPGDADTTTHILDHDMTWGAGYKFATVHQMVSEDGSTSQFVIDSKCATLIMADGHAMSISVDADFTKIYVEGKINLLGQAVIDLGEDPASNLGATNGTTEIDVTNHTPGLIVKNLGAAPVYVDLPPDSGDVKYYTYMVGNDLYFGTYTIMVAITGSGEITVSGPDGMGLQLTGGDQSLSGKIDGGSYKFTGLRFTEYKLTCTQEGQTVSQQVYAVITSDADHQVAVPSGTKALMNSTSYDLISTGPVAYGIYYDADGKVSLTMPDGTTVKMKFPMHTFVEVEHDGKVYDHCDCGYEVYLHDAEKSGTDLMPILAAVGVAILVGIAVFIILLYRRGRSSY